MFKKILNYLLPNHLENTTNKVSNGISFVLSYKDIAIGYLTYNNNTWMFLYSEEFKNQKDLSTILEFPDVTKIYSSDTLWPFFANRIPSYSQPKVEDYIKKHPEAKNNIVELLKYFGGISTNNPYRLNTQI